MTQLASVTYKTKRCKPIKIGIIIIQPVCLGCMKLIAEGDEYKIGNNGLVFHNGKMCEVIAMKRYIAYEQDYASSDNDIEPSTTIS